MAELEPISKIIGLIFKNYEQKEQQRPYLGGSAIGKGCDRALWYQFRWAFENDIDPRVRRLFETGHLEEARVIKNLRDAGLTVYDVDEDRQQYRYEDIGGHMSGGIDGVIKGVPESPEVPHLLEIKTSNDKAFKQIAKGGVEIAKPQHYAQMQVYMHWAGLKRALYIVVNKNTDDIYSERVEYRAKVAKALIERARAIIFAEAPPEKISEKSDYYLCKWCEFSPVCHGRQASDVNCRTCAHATPTKDGNWRCERHGANMTEAAQREGCEDHLHIPALVPFAKPTDAGDDWIKYQTDAGVEFYALGGSAFPPPDEDPEAALYSSHEIAALIPPAMDIKEHADAINRVKRTLGGKVVKGADK